MWFLSSYDFNIRESLVWHQGSPVSIRVVKGIVASLSSRGRGIRAQDALKGESRGLSRVVTGNPVFPGLVTVTSGSFSGCLLEVWNTVELEQDSQASSCVEEWNSACLSSCSRGDGPLVELYLEPANLSGLCNWGVSASSCCDFIHRVTFKKLSGHRFLIKSGQGNRCLLECGRNHEAASRIFL